MLDSNRLICESVIRMNLHRMEWNCQVLRAIRSDCGVCPHRMTDNWLPFIISSALSDICSCMLVQYIIDTYTHILGVSWSIRYCVDWSLVQTIRFLSGARFEYVQFRNFSQSSAVIQHRVVHITKPYDCSETALKLRDVYKRQWLQRP